MLVILWGLAINCLVSFDAQKLILVVAVNQRRFFEIRREVGLFVKAFQAALVVVLITYLSS